MNEPEPPIIVDEEGNLTIYMNVTVACGELESIDVTDGVYEAFDSRGYRLKVIPAESRVFMVIPPHSVADIGELRRRLCATIERHGSKRIGLEDVCAQTVPVMLDALLRFQKAEDSRMRDRSLGARWWKFRRSYKT